jgi:hypothetical protein
MHFPLTIGLDIRIANMASKPSSTLQFVPICGMQLDFLRAVSMFSQKYGPIPSRRIKTVG